MREVTCVLDNYIYDELTSVAIKFCKILMLESVACRQFLENLAKIGNTTQNEQHAGNM